MRVLHALIVVLLSGTTVTAGLRGGMYNMMDTYSVSAKRSVVVAVVALAVAMSEQRVQAQPDDYAPDGGGVRCDFFNSGFK